MNIFIVTNDPVKAFDSAKKGLEPNFMIHMKAAYRKIDEEDYKIIYPLNATEVFKVK